MGNEIVVKETGSYNPEELALITKTVANGVTELELKLFLHQCQRTGLDPLSNQIYCIKRKAKDAAGNWIEKATIQTGIDGFRLIADRTGRYAPGDPPQYAYDKHGKLVSARVGIWKLVGDKWFQVWGEAFWNEYVQTGKDGMPLAMWKTKPHIMLSKCAESAALRRGFPAELSGIYSNEEMAQADNATSFHQPEATVQSAPASKQIGSTEAVPGLLKLAEHAYRLLTAPDCYNMPRTDADAYMAKVPSTEADYSALIADLEQNLKIQKAEKVEVTG